MSHVGLYVVNDEIWFAIRDVMSMVRKNKDAQKSQATYAMFKGEDDDESNSKRLTNQMENIIDIR